MPLAEPEHFGTNADGTQNQEYCVYCLRKGAFTQDITMDGMILLCAGMLDEFNKDAERPLTREEAIAEMRRHFPTLKRWRTEP